MENHPPIGRMMAFETRYDVRTHVASSTDAERLPAMCGSATFATLVSSTSMNVASMTVMAITHGLTPVFFISRSLYLNYQTCTLHTRRDSANPAAAQLPRRRISLPASGQSSAAP